MRQTSGSPALLRSSSGFTLIELLLAMTILMVVSGGVMEGIMGIARVNRMIVNRSDMHAGVRNATELLQQEVGQSGRIALPGRVTIPAAVALGVSTVTVASTGGANATRGMFVGEKLSIDTGDAKEIVTVTAVPSTTQFTADFATTHLAGALVSATGGFSAGVIPTTTANGSTDSILKIMGDINDDGNMVYVEYRCDVAAGRLYRNSMAYNIGAKPAVTVEQILLDNIQANPGLKPNCFEYQERTIAGTTYVIGVAITLTVRTQQRDVNTNTFQTETKALLNVSPRNVFNVWQMASLSQNDYVQPIPPATALLLPN